MISADLSISSINGTSPIFHRAQAIPKYAKRIIASYGTGLGRLQIGRNYFFVDKITSEHYTGKLLSQNYTEMNIAVFNLTKKILSEIKTLSFESTVIYEINETLIKKNPMDTIEFSCHDTVEEESLKLRALIDGANYDVSSRDYTGKRIVLQKSEASPSMLHFFDGSHKGINISIHKRGPVRLTLVL